VILRKLLIARVLTVEQIEKPFELANSIIGMLTAAIITIEKPVPQ
jgi:hypothetical protein